MTEPEDRLYSRMAGENGLTVIGLKPSILGLLREIAPGRERSEAAQGR